MSNADNINVNTCEDSRRRMIYLVGMMGTGKSTVGKCLAQLTGGSFVDIDQYIEEREQRTIAEIFRDHGEAYFRDLESAILQELAQNNREMPEVVIVATGGGAFENVGNRRIIRESGTSIWLQTEPEEIVARLSNDRSRPLLQGDESSLLSKIVQILERRSINYRQAEIHIDTDGKTTEEICSELLNLLEIEAT